MDNQEALQCKKIRRTVSPNPTSRMKIDIVQGDNSQTGKGLKGKYKLPPIHKSPNKMNLFGKYKNRLNKERARQPIDLLDRSKKMLLRFK